MRNLDLQAPEETPQPFGAWPNHGPRALIRSMMRFNPELKWLQRASYDEERNAFIACPEKIDGKDIEVIRSLRNLQPGSRTNDLRITAEDGRLHIEFVPRKGV